MKTTVRPSESTRCLQWCLVIAAISFGSLLIGCRLSETDSLTEDSVRLDTPDSRPIVVVVNYPLEYFAQRIGGDLIRVKFPVPEDRDPAYWEPSGDQIAEIQSADLVLLNGADFAKWTLRATLPWSRTVVTCEGLEERLIEIPDAIVHSHGPEGEHSHAGLVSETWLDPDLAMHQCRVVYEALRGLAPDQASILEQRFLALERDLKALAGELDTVIEKAPVRWQTAQPRFHYLLSRYDVTPDVLHWEASASIEPGRWTEFAQGLTEDPTVVLWSEPPLDETIDRLLKAGVRSAVLETVANRPSEGDLVSVMRRNIGAIESLLAGIP